MTNSDCQITLVFASHTPEILDLATIFEGLVVNKWATGESIGDKTHTYNLIRLELGDGNYASALHSTETWLEQHSKTISKYVSLSYGAGVAISTFFQISDQFGRQTISPHGQSIRVPLSLISFCHEHHLEFMFSADAKLVAG